MRKLFFITFLVLLICSCKKDMTSWDTDLSAPLAMSRLGIADLLPDSIIEVDGDQRVSLAFHENIFEFGIDSLLDIEPDTVQKSFSIAPLLEFTFNPGQTFYSSDETFNFDGIEAQISHAILKNGSFYLRATNMIAGPLDITLIIPKATKNGVALQITETVPSADSSGPGILEKDIDVSDYELDLTGLSGNAYNELKVEFILKNPIDGEPITAYKDDVVKLELSYSQLGLKYAKGYFGSESLAISEGSYFEILKDFNDAVINLKEAIADIRFSNGFGVEVQASVFQLKGLNNTTTNVLSLNHSLIGSSINLSRATYNDGNVSPVVKSYLLNNSNSNITEWIEVLPDSIKINAQANLNPFGNISNYNDFISDKSKLSCDIDLRIPLQLSLSNLVFKDTTSIEWPNDDNFMIQSGILYLFAKNSFPANVHLQLTGLDDFNQAILDLNYYLENSSASGSTALIAGSSDNILVSSLLKFNLDAEAVAKMNEVSKVAIRAKFETENYPEEVTFTANDSLHILISTDITTRFSN